MAAEASAPAIPGYHLVEKRRTIGAHGGLATYYRKSLKLELTEGNEYGLYTKLILPTSERLSVINVYMPPTSSLGRRDITETQAQN
jgi:exonuclease III